MRSTGKITVKHYLNKRANPKEIGGKKFYPLYLQIIVAGHKAQLRSKLYSFLYTYKNYINKFISNPEIAGAVAEMLLTDELFRDLKASKIFPLSNLLDDELCLVTKIIDTKEPFGNDTFSLLSFSRQYSSYLEDIYKILDRSVKEVYLEELNRIFHDTSNKEEDRKLFKLANYFIHFINWKNHFCDIYEMTYEMLPSEIKFIENHLSEDLRTRIKSLMAFHSRENYLKRYLDKTEKGLIPTVHYLDWQEKGKDFISREFITIFGKQKAMEYITTLDSMLSRSVDPEMIL
jgi:hypothetical protein